MVKKFEEFINEGLWSKTFDRARTGEERLGDKLPPIPNEFKDDTVYRIVDFPEYFFMLDIADGNVYIDFYNVYHTPSDEKLSYVFQSLESGEVPYFTKSDFNSCLTDDSDVASDEEWNTLNSDKFISSLNDTLSKIPKEVWDVEIDDTI